MPRRKTIVKNSLAAPLVTPGLVDLHFHGAFGVDLMRASITDLDGLSLRLAAHGVAAFCPTTLSAPWPQLVRAVQTLGEWTARGRHPGARPLGIHLEGPYLAPGACGAHPARALRPAHLGELKLLWQASHGTISILTLAPERASPREMASIARFCEKNGILLSLGHSRATGAQARAAFDGGFRGVTHAWNAMPFHHRDSGILGAALGRKDVHVEIILDQIHVSAEVLRWTRALHPNLSYVSDCAPAAQTSPGLITPFGPLRVTCRDGACYTQPGGHLAGGGRLLSQQFGAWVESQSALENQPWRDILRRELPHATRIPLAALGLSSLAGLPRAEWTLTAGRPTARGF